MAVMRRKRFEDNKVDFGFIYVVIVLIKDPLLYEIVSIFSAVNIGRISLNILS